MKKLVLAILAGMLPAYAVWLRWLVRGWFLLYRFLCLYKNRKTGYWLMLSLDTSLKENH